MLLDDIIDLATDNKQSITVLLRKCLILASQLKNERLKAWANQELNGYTSEEGLPDYRITPAQAKGHLSGPFGSGWNHLPIPPAVLEKEHQKFAVRVPLIQAVSAYEDIVSHSSSGGSITVQWPANLVLYYQSKISQGMSLVAAYQEIPRSGLVEVLEAVRNRTLNMALELKAELGEVQDISRVSAGHAAQIERVIVNNIFGGNVYVSAGQSTMNAITVQQQQQNIVAGDWAHLEEVLRNAGIDQPELDELSKADEQDGRTMGSKVKGWIAKTAPKVLSGGVKIGATIGQTLLLEYLKQYYGLG
jgi:hypothetical protein